VSNIIGFKREKVLKLAQFFKLLGCMFLNTMSRPKRCSISWEIIQSTTIRQELMV